MVSKVAVIALVGILAVPILLGYALNLEQTTEKDYKTTGDSVNVTQLLQTSTDYTYAYADIYQLNTNFTNAFGQKLLPIYQTTNAKTSYPLGYSEYTGSYPAWAGTLEEWVYRYYENEHSGTGGFVVGNFIDPDGNTVQTVNRLHSFYFSQESMKIEYTYYIYSNSNQLGYGSIVVPSLLYKFSLTDTGNYQSNGWAEYYITSQTATSADFSKGYVVNTWAGPNIYLGEDYYNATVSFPDRAKYVIITLDLDSITDANYSFGLGTYCYLEKTTTDGVVSWQAMPRPRITDNPFPVTDLYYDPNGSNTYQIKIWVDPNGQPYDPIPGYNTYTGHYEFRYVGDWPSLIGQANYYKVIDVEYPFIGISPTFYYISLGGFSDHSPTMRVDAAEYRAMEYQVIENKTYDPAAFKENPSTTINNPTQYGSSFTFGGNTYNVTKGNITMGTHQIPVKGLVLSSVPNGNGGYDNKIGDTVVSTTAAPSTITFNGKWSASISTTAQEEYEYTKTEWIAGGFAWNGMDDSFLMVGLITSLGVFIALGIYARRTRASVWPLMLVCGGAAALFFIML